MTDWVSWTGIRHRHHHWMKTMIIIGSWVTASRQLVRQQPPAPEAPMRKCPNLLAGRLMIRWHFKSVLTFPLNSMFRGTGRDKGCR